MDRLDLPLVLIVDDNDRNRKLARDVLSSAGFRTLEAASGGEAISVTVEHRPDIVLMDLRLPDLDGLAATRLLRADPRTSQIAVVALSALPLDTEGGWLSEAGFDGCITKPIDIDSFPGQVLALAAPRPLDTGRALR